MMNITNVSQVQMNKSTFKPYKIVTIDLDLEALTDCKNLVPMSELEIMIGKEFMIQLEKFNIKV